MDNDIIQAYLWQGVIKLAFSPSGDKDIKSWIHQYGCSLPGFWEIAEYPKTSEINGQFQINVNFHQINISFDCSITNIDKFTVSLSHIANTTGLMWTHDVDFQYFAFPSQSLLNKLNKGKQATKKISTQHIERVLDGLIFHPRSHQHIEYPINNHEIRIGGGIDNPFLYLFHLRYQLCPIPEKRSEEKNRLNELFTNAIENRSAITPDQLLKVH
ncbi:MAG: hypothetical protein PF482_21560 [Desulfobacteraceae bacterium]|jgi:hypothetical protein|nr:hypothetical protein [Desulfobacteraceae bacterium]